MRRSRSRDPSDSAWTRRSGTVTSRLDAETWSTQRKSFVRRPQTTFGCQNWSGRTGFGQDYFSHDSTRVVQARSRGFLSNDSSRWRLRAKTIADDFMDVVSSLAANLHCNSFSFRRKRQKVEFYRFNRDICAEKQREPFERLAYGERKTVQ